MYDICFITTPTPELEDDRLEPPLGLLYLASYLKHGNDNISLKIVDLCQIPETQWDIPEAKYYGFTTYSTTYHRTVDIKNKIRAMYPKSKSIAGGAHASAMPIEVKKEFDYVVIGEGEITLWNIINGWSQPGIIEGNPYLDLDRLPFPDYSLIDFNTYHRIVDGKRSLSILSSRGCPYKCAFCNSIILGGNHRVRFRTPQNVINELINLMDQYGDINFRFQDDMFASRLEWLREFTRLVKPLDITYRAFARVTQCANKEFVDLFVEGGCKHLALGVDSGSNTILKNMNKSQTRADIILGLKNAKEAGLIRRIYLIVGFPGETWETIEETAQLVEEAQPDEFVVYPLIPYPGTSLWYNPEKWGLYNISKDFTKYFQIYGDKQSHFVYDLKDYDRYELQAMKDYLVTRLEKAHAVWARNSKGYV